MKQADSIAASARRCANCFWGAFATDPAAQPEQNGQCRIVRPTSHCVPIMRPQKSEIAGGPATATLQPVFLGAFPAVMPDWNCGEHAYGAEVDFPDVAAPEG